MQHHVVVHGLLLGPVLLGLKRATRSEAGQAEKGVKRVDPRDHATTPPPNPYAGYEGHTLIHRFVSSYNKTDAFLLEYERIFLSRVFTLVAVYACLCLFLRRLVP